MRRLLQIATVQRYRIVIVHIVKVRLEYLVRISFSFSANFRNLNRVIFAQ